MPLSENEQRQLDAIERALYADDPKFAHAVRFTEPRTHARRHIVGGAVLVGVGLGVLLGGAISGFWYVGIVGFVVMLFGATRAYGGAKRLTGARRGSPPRPQGLRERGPHGRGPVRGLGGRTPRPKGGQSRIVEYFEERWRRRGEAH